ncbi:hypothetical protein GMRT_21306 [Giardia muris]|uniref:Uncharacterized protein n=1 Tax=Giardia muris TaxID=5742 RepID=A0A4Z1SXM5_GIAMU|nr:hypothetical protein GMRT_21306 [Giardia muris]|eukprot:TNJ30474.1 hypothetical protein GMRT_21306 [Giardia muris]
MRGRVQLIRPSPSRGLRGRSARSAMSRLTLTPPLSTGSVTLLRPLRLELVLLVVVVSAQDVERGTTSCSREAVMTRPRSLGTSCAERLQLTVLVRRLQPRIPLPSSRTTTSTSVTMRQMEEKRTAGRAPTPRIQAPSRARSASRATTLPPRLPSSVRSAPSSTVDPVQTARMSARPASTASRGYGCNRAGLWGRGGPNEHPEESRGPSVPGAGRW